MTITEYVGKVQSSIQGGYYGYRKDRYIANHFLWDDANGGLNTFDFPDNFGSEEDVIEYIVGSIRNDIDYIFDGVDSNGDPIILEDDPEYQWLKSEWSDEQWREIVLTLWGDEIREYWNSL